jgi:hypothetical protein
MRIATSLLLLVVMSPVYGQSDSKENAAPTNDPGVRKHVEKLHESRRPHWTYSDLASKSDLVVIAKVKSRSEVKWDVDIAGDFGKETAKLIENRLQVLSVLNGRSGDEVKVLTLESKPDVVVSTDFDFAELRTRLLLPSFVTVVVDGQITGYGGSQPIKTYKIEPEYLLYLRKLSDDKYVPVTGQRYSGMSVRTLNN